MLEICRDLGRQALEGKSPAERKEEFLKSQTIVPEQPGDYYKGDPYEIVINLNTEKDVIELKAGRELDPTQRREFFGFELQGSRSRKIYFTTNNAHYHLETIPDHISYVEDKLDDFDSHYLNWLKSLNDQFYVEMDSGKQYLDLRKLESRLRKNEIMLDEFNGWGITDGNIQYSEISKSKMKSLLNELLSKSILGSSRKSDAENINLASLKIDGEYIQKSKFSEKYNEIVYYNQHERLFESSERMSKKDKVCSMCQGRKPITGKINLPRSARFYITDKHNFFENQSQKKAYKSFALCEDCYQEVLHGINQIERDYEGELFGTDYYLVPKNVSAIEEFKEHSNYLINSIFKRDMGSSQDEMEKHDEILNEMSYQNLRFDFLFFFLGRADFNVIELIPDVRIQDIQSILSTIKDIQGKTIYRNRGELKLTLGHLYWLLFPNRNSHSNPDPEVYRKDLIGLFKSLLKHTSVSVRSLLNRFNSIFSRIHHRSDNLSDYINNPLLMNQILELFNQEAQLKGVCEMSESASVTDVPVDEVQRFFEAHSNLYEESPHRQGLVMLGYLMNGIWYEQEQEGKSTTVFDKLNFDGMSPRRLDRFINDMTEYIKLYDRWTEWETGEIHAAMMDRLQDITESNLSKDEVLFYILTGFSLGRQIGIQKAQQSQEGGQSNE